MATKHNRLYVTHKQLPYFTDKKTEVWKVRRSSRISSFFSSLHFFLINPNWSQDTLEQLLILSSKSLKMWITLKCLWNVQKEQMWSGKACLTCNPTAWYQWVTIEQETNETSLWVNGEYCKKVAHCIFTSSPQSLIINSFDLQPFYRPCPRQPTEGQHSCQDLWWWLFGGQRSCSSQNPRSYRESNLSWRQHLSAFMPHLLLSGAVPLIEVLLARW